MQPVQTPSRLRRQAQAAPAAGMPVQIQLPATLSPALARSLQQSLQKAALLLAERSAGLVDAADRLAEVVVGVAEPDRELVADRIRRMETVRQVFAEGEWLTAEDINRLQPTPPANKALPASDWKRRGRIFSVAYNGREYFARYQFDALYQPLPIIRRVLDAFGEAADPWVLAAWFHHPNGWLGRTLAKGSAPESVAPCHALDHGDAVVAAAARRHGSYVA